MPNKTYDASGTVIATTYPDPTVVAGGTDVTADANGVIWGWLYVGDYSELDVDVTVVFTGGASPTLTLNVDRAFADTVAGPNQQFASNVATAAAVATGTTTSFSIGAGMTSAKGFGRYVRVAWTTIAGGPTNLVVGVYVIGKV